jgi:hypothetical protein
MGDIEAGKAHITNYVENSQFFKGLKAAEGAFKNFGSKLASIGSKMTGIGDAIGLTMGQEFTGKFMRVVAGATLGAAIAAPLGKALGEVFRTDAARGLIAQLLTLRDSLAKIIEVMANALVPPLLMATRIVTGTVQGINRWVAGNQKLIILGAKIVTTIGTVGAVLAVVGSTIAFIGSGFGMLATAAAAVGGFLATPLGLIVAIGAGIAIAAVAWMRFTESGKAAAQFLLDIFTPTLDIIRQTLGGIGDALTAGNLQLAGQIAVTGLQLLFQQGVDSIAELLGGVFGEVIGDIGTRLISGDLKGAWDSTVTAMGTLWASFSAGVVEVFSAAANAVLTAWQKVTSTITDALLDSSAGGGIWGSVVSKFLGVDVQKQVADNARMDRERQARGMGGPQDLLGEGKKGARDQIAGQAAAGKNWVDQLRKQAEETGAAAVEAQIERNKKAPSGSDRERELQNRLDGLTKQAAKEAAGLPKLAGLPDKEEFGKVAVGFSGAALALQLQGGGQNPQREMLGEMKKNKELLAEAVEVLKKLKDKFGGALGITD